MIDFKQFVVRIDEAPPSEGDAYVASYESESALDLQADLIIEEVHYAGTRGYIGKELDPSWLALFDRNEEILGRLVLSLMEATENEGRALEGSLGYLTLARDLDANRVELVFSMATLTMDPGLQAFYDWQAEVMKAQ